MADDPYQVLGLSKGASEDDIRRAYLKLVKELHPDVNPSKSAEERFKKVTAAHELLGDPEQRARFDRGEIDAAGEPRQYGYTRQRGPGAGTRASGPVFEEFGDIFSDIFGGGGGRTRGAAGSGGGFASRGNDLRYTLDVDFVEAAQGTKKRVTLPSGGQLDIAVPEGVADGQVLRLRGKGEQGFGGGTPGDALVEIQVRPHATFKRSGDDVMVEVPITIDEAILGGKIEVTTLTGRVQLTIPKGSSSGRVLRLKGKGITNGGTKNTGDQLVTLRIVVPDEIDDELSYFISEWRQKNKYDPGRT